MKRTSNLLKPVKQPVNVSAAVESYAFTTVSQAIVYGVNEKGVLP
jgi:hypothetical protein